MTRHVDVNVDVAVAVGVAETRETVCVCSVVQSSPPYQSGAKRSKAKRHPLSINQNEGFVAKSLCSQMQSTFAGVGGGGGLSRFSSAPATWLEALLEDDEDPLKPDQSLSHLLVDDSFPQGLRHSGGDCPASADTSSLFDADSAGSSVGFLRQNSSPAEFLGVESDAYFSSFGTPSNYDYDLPSGSGKLARDENAQRRPSPKFPVQLMKREERSMMLDSSLDMEMEKSMEDSMQCRVRAKRGCATHPRSIAERVRRTRISDRIRKLQELVPNMDKQTNTADMLEEAVKYVKHLQKQIEELSEHQGKCKCSVKD